MRRAPYKDQLSMNAQARESGGRCRKPDCKSWPIPAPDPKVVLCPQGRTRCRPEDGDVKDETGFVCGWLHRDGTEYSSSWFKELISTRREKR